MCRCFYRFTSKTISDTVIDSGCIDERSWWIKLKSGFKSIRQCTWNTTPPPPDLVHDERIWMFVGNGVWMVSNVGSPASALILSNCEIIWELYFISVLTSAHCSAIHQKVDVISSDVFKKFVHICFPWSIILLNFKWGRFFRSSKVN